MTEPRWPLAVGGRLMIDGETITVHSVEGAEVRGYTEGGEPVRFVLTRIALDSASVCNEEWRFGPVMLEAGALSDAQLRGAAELLAHLNEAWFGYRSGDPGRPSPGEPRPGFDPEQTTVRQRVAAKAAELGCSAGKLHQKRGELSDNWTGGGRQGISPFGERERLSKPTLVRKDKAQCAQRTWQALIDLQNTP